MKVRYLKSMGRPRGYSPRPGDEAEVDDAEAKRLIAKGIAEPVKSSRSETTTSAKAKSAEKAVPAKPKKPPKKSG